MCLEHSTTFWNSPEGMLCSLDTAGELYGHSNGAYSYGVGLGEQQGLEDTGNGLGRASWKRDSHKTNRISGENKMAMLSGSQSREGVLVRSLGSKEGIEIGRSDLGDPGEPGRAVGI